MWLFRLLDIFFISARNFDKRISGTAKIIVRNTHSVEPWIHKHFFICRDLRNQIHNSYAMVFRDIYAFCFSLVSSSFWARLGSVPPIGRPRSVYKSNAECRENPNVHIWSKFGDSSSNQFQINTLTSQILYVKLAKMTLKIKVSWIVGFLFKLSSNKWYITCLWFDVFAINYFK